MPSAKLRCREGGRGIANPQVAIFNALQNNLDRVDFSQLLRDVITIADEVDSQLKPAMLGYAEPGPIAVSAA